VHARDKEEQSLARTGTKNSEKQNPSFVSLA
jgi:hypothetical protein